MCRSCRLLLEIAPRFLNEGSGIDSDNFIALIFSWSAALPLHFSFPKFDLILTCGC